ncbi:Hypothetical protein LUCI_3632 [Lucifera butyrica]|uniref:DUF1836 domain-containing protein n=1 Tax=Lucifera butyrica TaxID=1351585 RepID=A0A498RBP4_9FIRM|nr:DUF1836 domain-containing protein [Lucifera butyrica]VBB08360.1 Hypothetical protein LUCI_3632 [Lucifera butyrica]
MKLDRGDICGLIDALCLSEDIKGTDIPAMDLYMDQLITFLNGKLQSSKREANDKIFTKTMVNNYTKDELLVPPKNKKYNKEHVMLLILMYHLKNVLTIQDIKRLFQPVLRDMSTTEDDIISLETIYDIYLELKKNQLDEFSSHFPEKWEYIRQKTLDIENADNREMADLFLTVMVLIAQANAAKRLAEKIIDRYF